MPILSGTGTNPRTGPASQTGQPPRFRPRDPPPLPNQPRTHLLSRISPGAISRAFSSARAQTRTRARSVPRSPYGRIVTTPLLGASAKGWSNCDQHFARKRVLTALKGTFPAKGWRQTNQPFANGRAYFFRRMSEMVSGDRSMVRASWLIVVRVVRNR